MENIKKAEKIYKILDENGYNPIVAKDLKDAEEILFSLMPKESSVAMGGSVTLNKMNILERIKKNYNFYDRFKDVPWPETVKLMRQSLLADYLVTGINAITEKGELIARDSSGNRCASLIFGPKKVIVITGINKLVADISQAEERIEQAAIKNAKRIGHKPPCVYTQTCENCDHPDRVCNYTSIIHNGRKFPGRYTIIIVPEELGY